MWGAFGVLVFGLVIIMYWALAMFTDTGYGEFARETSAEIGHKNNLALTIPSTGLMFVFGSATMVAEGSDSTPVFVCGILSVVCMLVVVVSFTPVPLPAWMYPEWHLARRREGRLARIAEAERRRSGARAASSHPLPGDSSPHAPDLSGDDA